MNEIDDDNSEENNNDDNNENIDFYPFLDKTLTYDRIKDLFNGLEMKTSRPRRFKFPSIKMLNINEVEIKNLPEFKKYKVDDEIQMIVEEPCWYKYTDIIDFFQEQYWIHSKRYDQLSPAQVWNNKHEEISTIAKTENIDIRTILMRYVKGVSKFRPTLMKALIRIFRAKSILDFCAGFGHRLIGTLSDDRNIKLYCGVDPNKKLHKGYQKMISSFVPKDSHKKYNMICACAEDIIYDSTQYDLIVTSPPYFDLEIYCDDTTQSIQRYPNFEDWYQKFLLAATRNACNRLKFDGYLVMSINDKLEDDEIQPSTSFVTRFVQDVSKWMDMNYLGVMVYGEDEYHLQPLFIWKKLKLNNY